MTRHQRRKLAAERKETKLVSLADAERARRNAAIIAANVGQLRNGVKFETSGALAPKAYREFGRHSGTAHVMGTAPKAATPFVSSLHPTRKDALVRP
jgi:hypothetical protein